jgi:hypothetical protein
MDTHHLFDRLQENAFRPLTGSLGRLNWRVIERLHSSLFDEPGDTGGIGRPRSETIRIIEAVIERYPALWLPEDGGPAPETPLNVRSNQLYARLIETGWLQEERRGYHVFVSMPHTASQLAAALVEIAEGRPLIMSGKLKAIRAAVHSVVDDPTNNADALEKIESQILISD